MNIIELAKEHGIRVCQANNHYEFYDVTNLQLQAFATAIAKQAVDEFKAGLVPTACYIPNGAYFKDDLSDYHVSTLYALPLGETK